tara:strand:- start:10101 stop:11156 length:1056 start_codon:yes stop_codon:yes gene_type:complete
MIKFSFIETKEQLLELVKNLTKETELAIDLECENNLHHFGTFISLIQISNKSQNWVIDVLKLKEIQPLLKILADPNIKKIIHDVSFDLRILNHQFDCQLKNIFDTQLAASFIGKEKIGLGSLLEEYFQIKKEKKFQRVDWTKRPLSRAMLEYAVKDTAYLIKLKEVLLAELGDRSEWIFQECRHLEEMDFSYKEQDYIDLSGAKSLSPKHLGILRALFDERKKIAKEVDRPVFMIFSNKQLMAFSVNSPYSVNSWKNLRSVHPIIKRRAERLYQIVKNAKPEVYQRTKKKRFTIKQFTEVNELAERRNKLAEKLQLKRNLLLNNQQMRDIVSTGKLTTLRNWQKRLVEKII